MNSLLREIPVEVHQAQLDAYLFTLPFQLFFNLHSSIWKQHFIGNFTRSGCSTSIAQHVSMFGGALVIKYVFVTSLIQVQRIEEEQKDQARLYQETIRRLKDELFRKRQQYNLVLQQGQPDAYKTIRDLNLQVEDLKQKYFQYDY